MTMTTIKVSTDLRDRLKSHATAEQLTMNSYLEKLLEREERAHRFAVLREQMANTSEEDWKSYREETQWWDTLENG
ncbi:hypothetical protein PTQ19_04305 [Microbacterium esteraromaticum]|uniref:hypothetical protein n=1 Tax=Microbacterium esteraromaticum TaxID=57043 RepID=UPI002368E909|nr:hypothetical protein [Microbacterium esteraromaticum]WDH79677.1 hypothetical protein PTQ19_04305 [Microbacterium esteraromaticum]